MHPMRVVGVRVELPANQPVVLLREEDGVRYLPIWIGAVEASAIAFQQQGVQTVRPLTHDLLRDVINALGVRLEAVHITELRDDVFYAELRFTGGVKVSARPSDAIALALRCEVDDPRHATRCSTRPASRSRTSRRTRSSSSGSSSTTISPEDFAAGDG